MVKRWTMHPTREPCGSGGAHDQGKADEHKTILIALDSHLECVKGDKMNIICTQNIDRINSLYNYPYSELTGSKI